MKFFNIWENFLDGKALTQPTNYFSDNKSRERQHELLKLMLLQMLFYYQLGFLNFLCVFSDFLTVFLALRGRFAYEIMEDKWLQREGAMEELLQKRRKGCQTLEEEVVEITIT